jgi:hypothetical protein
MGVTLRAVHPMKKRVEDIIQQNVSGYRIGGAGPLAGWILDAVADDLDREVRVLTQQPKASGPKGYWHTKGVEYAAEFIRGET